VKTTSNSKKVEAGITEAILTGATAPHNLTSGAYALLVSQLPEGFFAPVDERRVDMLVGATNGVIA
jgi:hypothetical protein